jgi:hypothetical protein
MISIKAFAIVSGRGYMSVRQSNEMSQPNGLFSAPDALSLGRLQASQFCGGSGPGIAK